MTWVLNNLDQIKTLLAAHLLLCLPPIVVSLLAALPIGVLTARRPGIGRFVRTASSTLYAVPALPLLIAIPLLFGFPLRSTATVITALSIYGVALMVGSTADAFSSVDPMIRQAAVAVGYSRTALFWAVDLPLAGPVLLAGLRVVAVSTVSLVTIGALIGVSGLGTLLTDGFQRGILAEVLTGIAATVVVAVVIDGLLLAIERLLMPWTLKDVAR